MNENCLSQLNKVVPLAPFFWQLPRFEATEVYVFHPRLQGFLNTKKKKVVFLETKSKKDYTWNMESYGTEYGSPIIR